MSNFNSRPPGARPLAWGCEVHTPRGKTGSYWHSLGALASVWACRCLQTAWTDGHSGVCWTCLELGRCSSPGCPMDPPTRCQALASTSLGDAWLQSASGQETIRPRAECSGAIQGEGWTTPSCLHLARGSTDGQEWVE